ncbi:MAG: response regulator [Acidobacteriaceae bacterium]
MEDEEGTTRLLFVDDEASIRMTLPLILERYGFQVTVSATVKEALQEISSKSFDLLLTDLNIGQPGDGFTVVSAMRRSQPTVATVILTGYPAFETALAAIRSQVDDYVVKPAHPEQLVETLRSRLKGRSLASHIKPKRVPYVIEENKEKIIDDWVRTVGADAELACKRLSRDGLVDHVPKIIDEIVRISTSPDPANEEVDLDVAKAAVEHGKLRRRQGYTVDMMARETRMLRKTIALCVQTHLLSVEISQMLPDMVCVSEIIDRMLETAVKSFQGD